MTSVTFTMTFNITDPATVIAAAKTKVADFWDDKTDGPMNIAQAVRYLMDCDLPEGLEAVDSNCEED